MLRFFYFVFNANKELVGDFMLVVGTMAAAGMIYGSVKALQQRICAACWPIPASPRWVTSASVSPWGISTV